MPQHCPAEIADKTPNKALADSSSGPMESEDDRSKCRTPLVSSGGKPLSWCRHRFSISVVDSATNEIAIVYEITHFARF